jgi:hypothetical protein
MLLSLKLFISCVVGVAAHLGLFIRGEWHMQAPVVIFLHILLGSFTFLSEVRKQGLSLSSLLSISAIIVGYLFGLFSSIVAYRLSPRHRLYKFPGPRLAAVSKFWHVWQCRDSRNHELMDNLHEEYGDFARIGMKTLF